MSHRCTAGILLVRSFVVRFFPCLIEKEKFKLYSAKRENTFSGCTSITLCHPVTLLDTDW